MSVEVHQFSTISLKFQLYTLPIPSISLSPVFTNPILRLPRTTNTDSSSTTRWHSVSMIRIRLPRNIPRTVYIDELVLDHLSRRQGNRHKPKRITTRILRRRKGHRAARRPVAQRRYIA